MHELPSEQGRQLVLPAKTNATAQLSRLIPLRFPGGKFYALTQLAPFYSGTTYDDFREPFAGGASVFFSKPKVEHNWLNDIDEELINLYEVMADTSLREKLVELTSHEVATKERWKEVRLLKPTNSLERAFKYYYLNRTSFSGKLSSPAWGYRPKRSLPPERWRERLIPCGKKLEGVKLTAGDFAEAIEAPSAGNSTLLFVDPPYYHPPKKKHYLNGFDESDHMRLLKLLKGTSHKFILTYDDVPEIQRLYSWAYVHPINFYYRVDDSSMQEGRRRRGTELVITNFKAGGE